MTIFEGEEVHNKDNVIKVGPNSQFTIIKTHLPNMYQRGLELASQDSDTRTLTTMLLSWYMFGFFEGEAV